MKHFFLAIAAVSLTMSAGAALAAPIENFDGPVAIGPTQAPGVWYTDRMAPDSFVGGVNYGGRNGVLELGIDNADYQGGTFYDTQGRKFDVGPGVNTVSIDLYVDPTFMATKSDARLAGFWGSTVGGPDDPAYPIVELARISQQLVFRGWDNTGSWFNLGTLGAGDLGTWKTLSLGFDGSGNFTYKAGSFSGSTNAFGTTSFDNVILQGHNNNQDYAAHFDNLTGGAVPEPGTWALMILGFGGAGAMLRRRNSQVLAA